MNKHRVIILRGLPGSGKSTFVANKLPNAVVCSADHFFMVNGEYKFDGKKIGAAHQACQGKFLLELSKKPHVIVVDNTNLTTKEYKFYMENALKVTSDIHIVTLKVDSETSFQRNLHSVPKESINRMANRMQETPEKWDEYVCDGTCFPDINKLVCDDCSKMDDTVVEGFCPYLRDVYDENEPATLCENCYHERCMDI